MGDLKVEGPLYIQPNKAIAPPTFLRARVYLMQQAQHEVQVDFLIIKSLVVEIEKFLVLGAQLHALRLLYQQRLVMPNFLWSGAAKSKGLAFKGQSHIVKVIHTVVSLLLTTLTRCHSLKCAQKSLALLLLILYLSNVAIQVLGK